MGNKSSQEDQQCLLNGNEGDDEILPVFEELKLVLIGSQGVGKNSIGNAILRKKVFTFWRGRKHADIKETRTVSQRRIHLTRTPGWKEDWNNPEKTKNDIFHCVKSLFITKPHAVLLTLKVNSKLSELTISTLENLLTAQLWDHTIVLFTHRKKLDCTIEDYIIHQHLQPLIDKCGQRYFVIQKNYSQITDTIEELIAKKNVPGCFKPHDQIKDDNIILSDLKVLVTRIKSKISSILTYKDNFKNSRNKRSNKALLDSKDKEIERLNTIVEEKEREIRRLQSRTQDRPELSALRRRIAELEGELKEMKHENVTLKKENEELKKELQIHQHAGYRNKLCQDVKRKSMTRNTQTQLHMQLHDLSSKGSALNNWSETLLKILEMLKDYEVKKLKFFLNNDEEFTISIDSIVDSVDLANAIKNQWDKQRAVLKLQHFIKKIPRNDDKMIQLFTPFLKEIGKTW
ncbi:uncharacterized protein LOC125260362 [Megalobrama amblycephala]|uniref:uncharacterized protein LOC125260362 n=1 Tax=Megalobrama amblycephala TaxID=75352 RepID=UPI0020142342|nr:uncharacterized protein LOC125260362 [Megalobrama amblycephala]XP_048034760.1 uncharacterized protein LOC125260362 [Megalobrama amblycephala]XP_048034832.1 uncharacterized protein LOC125260362 [Megalobrama amblycephala]